jgi:hypothetical protein
MATVQSLSTALKKTSDEVIEILVNAGIGGKTANSEISGDERKILMAGLSKRGSAKSSISVSRKPSTKSSDGAGGVKIQVKKKRPIQAPITPVQDDAAVLKPRLDKPAIKILRSSPEISELAVLPSIPAFTRISITSSEVFFNAVDND